MRNINKIILHCSASDMRCDDDIKAIKNLHTSKRTKKIKWGKYNTHGKAFSDVGYHYFIRKDGLVQRGRDIMTMGAHCKGQNGDSVGICLSGDNKCKFTDFQFVALNNLIRSLNIRLSKKLTVYPHNKYSSKSCPNFSVDDFKIKYLK